MEGFGDRGDESGVGVDRVQTVRDAQVGALEFCQDGFEVIGLGREDNGIPLGGHGMYINSSLSSAGRAVKCR